MPDPESVRLEGTRCHFRGPAAPNGNTGEEKPKRDGFLNADTPRPQPAAQAGHLTVRRGAEPERRFPQTNLPLHLQKGEGFA